MMYSEFAENVRCRDNEHNHKVFRDLEILYMNSNLSKDEIYEYGRKLVDNSKTETELALEQECKDKIVMYRDEIRKEKRELEYYKSVDPQNGRIQSCRWYIKHYQNKIWELKWVLGLV